MTSLAVLLLRNAPNESTTVLILVTDPSRHSLTRRRVTRPGTMTEEELAAHDTFGKVPSIAAGQIAPWNQDFIMSYQGMAEATEGIAIAIEGADKIS